MITSTIRRDVLTDVRSYFENAPDIAKKAAVMALNQAIVRKGLKGIKSKINQEINFPRGYLDTPGRLSVIKATKGKLEARVRARARPTSLARFGTQVGNKVLVKVSKSGQSKVLPRAFMINLSSGNRGLAIRLPAGENPKSAYKPTRIVSGSNSRTDLWLLYGPSVYQIMNNVVDEVTPEVEAYVKAEFMRQFIRLST